MDCTLLSCSGDEDDEDDDDLDGPTGKRAADDDDDDDEEVRMFFCQTHWRGLSHQLNVRRLKSPKSRQTSDCLCTCWVKTS